MLATDELELAFPGTGAPALGDGPPLRRILVAVRAPGQAAEALAVAARLCRTIGGVLRLVHVRPCDRPVRRVGRFYPETSGNEAAMLDEAPLAVRACGGPQSIAGCSIRASRDPQGGNHARAESHHHGRGRAGAGSGRDRSRRGHRGRTSRRRRRHPRLLQQQRDQRLARACPPGRGGRMPEELDGDHLEHDRAGGTTRTSRAYGSHRAPGTCGTGRTSGTEGRYRGDRASRPRRTTRASRTAGAARAARVYADTNTYAYTYSDSYSHPDSYSYAYPQPDDTPRANSPGSPDRGDCHRREPVGDDQLGAGQ